MVGACALLCSCALTQNTSTVQSDADPLTALSSSAETSVSTEAGPALSTDITTDVTAEVTADASADEPSVLSVIIDGDAADAAPQSLPNDQVTIDEPTPAADGSTSTTVAEQPGESPTQSSTEPAEAPETAPDARPAPSTTEASTTTTSTGSPATAQPSTSRPALNLLPPRLQHELVDELNDRRGDLGLGPVEFSLALADEAEACALQSLQNRELAHCDHEVLWMGAIGVSSDQLLEAWFNSELHKQALTYDTSTKAGGALVIDLNTGLAVAALRIDY